MQRFLFLPFTLTLHTIPAFAQDTMAPALAPDIMTLGTQSITNFQGFTDQPFNFINGRSIADITQTDPTLEAQIQNWTNWTEIQNFADAVELPPPSGPFAIQTGTLITKDYLAQGNAPQTFTESIGNGNSGPIILDGISTTPNQPVDLFEVYNNDGSFWGIIEKPTNVTSTELRSVHRTEKRSIRPRTSKQGDKIVSSLSHLLDSIANELCTMVPRPKTLVLEVTAGVDFFASFSGSAQVTLDLNTHCPS